MQPEPVIKRPLPVTIIAVVLVITGVLGIARHVSEVDKDLPIVLATELVAIIAGVFLWRGQNWARWLALVWLAFHVVISFGSVQAVVMHSAILAVFAFFLFLPSVNAYFTARR